MENDQDQGLTVLAIKRVKAGIGRIHSNFYPSPDCIRLFLNHRHLPLYTLLALCGSTEGGPGSLEHALHEKGRGLHVLTRLLVICPGHGDVVWKDIRQDH
eukprot:GFUD01126582.1.p1 GENE.GFUD01126582.1~~GFUD01126582.1.p1  ORF type:complete len:100 (+),score=13.94 GFUD01126582.1:72-371(+)